MIDNFIIVRVRETPFEASQHRTPTGHIRQGIHDYALEYDIDVADFPIRGDVNRSFGRDMKTLYAQAGDLFNRGMDFPEWVLEQAKRNKERIEARLRETGGEERVQRIARSKAVKANKIVQSYIEKYGDDL